MSTITSPRLGEINNFCTQSCSLQATITSLYEETFEDSLVLSSHNTYIHVQRKSRPHHETGQGRSEGYACKIHMYHHTQIAQRISGHGKTHLVPLKFDNPSGTRPICHYTSEKHTNTQKPKGVNATLTAPTQKKLETKPNNTESVSACIHVPNTYMYTVPIDTFLLPTH